MPFQGLNIDNLPFFAVIAAVAEGQTLLHDWVYENRAIYLTELNKLGAQVKLLDPHRVLIEAETDWHRNAGQHTAPMPRITADMTAPPSTGKVSRAWVETLFN